MRDPATHPGLCARRRGIAAAEIAAVGVTLSLVAGAAVVVVPMSIKASPVQGAAEQPERIPADTARAEPLLAVHEFVRAGGALVNADSTSAMFWYRDDHDRGIMNEDELVVLRFQSTVGAFIASRIEAADEPSPRVQPDTVLSHDFASHWAYKSDVESDVISGGFDDVRIETTRDRPGATTLIFRFNWANRDADALGEEYGFRVTLPSVREDGAKRRGEIE